MKIPLMTLSLLAALALSASAMSPAAEAFLRKVGIDPGSEQAGIADKDGAIATTYRGDSVVHSLESLVATNKKNGVVHFVATRAFIRSLKTDYARTVVPTSNFDQLYLTLEERSLVARKLADDIAGD